MRVCKMTYFKHPGAIRPPIQLDDAEDSLAKPVCRFHERENGDLHTFLIHIVRD